MSEQTSSRPPAPSTHRAHPASLSEYASVNPTVLQNAMLTPRVGGMSLHVLAQDLALLGWQCQPIWAAHRHHRRSM